MLYQPSILFRMYHQRATRVSLWSRILMLIISLPGLTETHLTRISAAIFVARTHENLRDDLRIFSKMSSWLTLKFYNILHSRESYFLHKVPVSWTHYIIAVCCTLTLTSCLPAARNMFLHLSLDTMGTVVWGTKRCQSTMIVMEIITMITYILQY